MFVLFNRKINSKFIQSLLYLFSPLCLVSIIIFSILLPLHTIAEGVSVKYLKNSLNQIPSNKNVILPKQFFMFSTKN